MSIRKVAIISTIKYRILNLLVAAVMLSSCASSFVKHPNLKSEIDDRKSRKIAIFFDGTQNDEASNTNVSSLHKLVYLQDDPKMHTIYVKGVGTEGVAPIWGAITGAGVEEDVLHAYSFLADVYRPNMGDQIYIFGFSRGAYAARIFAGFLAVASLPDFSSISFGSKEALYREMFARFKRDESIAERKSALLKMEKYHPILEEVEIEFMGLWDTVAALGFPNGVEDTDELDREYVDQLCNVKRAAHALSIDDNRSTLFTPVLLSSNRLIDVCKSDDRSIDGIVNEVWFSGSHSDVGGGYDNSELSGVSLNWMIYQLQDDELLPKGTRVFADPLGKSNTTDTDILGYIIYRNYNRRISFYYGNENNNYNQGKPKIHRSVFDRLEKISKVKRQFDWRWDYGNGKDGEKLPNFIDCVECIDSEEVCSQKHGYHLRPKENQSCLSVIEYSDW